MKKKLHKILLLALVLGCGSLANAQYNTAIGLRAGESSGLTVKHFLGGAGSSNALEFIVSAFPNDLAIFCIYEKHKPLGNGEGFSLYYGAGGHVAFDTYRRGYYYYDRHGRAWWYRDRAGFGIGVDGMLGIEFKIPDVPLAFSLDLKPYIEFNTDRNMYWSPDPGLGIKVAF